ncbi:unnamed protein product [Ectocarpus sp. 13 AM-2016]
MASEDRAALVALFRSTGGTRWIRNANWDTDADLSQWSRVQVNDDDRVVKLSLANNCLGGTIPEALGALTELKELYLFNNKLTGPIPEALGALKDLEILTLSGNKLTGEKTCICKDDIIHFMNKLHRSNLLHVLNAYTGSIPPWLGSLQKLQQLGLNDNELAGPIPEALGALPELTGLLLSYNKLTGPIPEALGALKGVTYLWFDHNKLTGSIPKWLGSLSMLRGLRLNDNQLVGHIPKELGNLTILRELHVHHNRLTGGIPTELGNLSALSTFEFGNTRSKSLFRRGNKLAGGPAKGEGLDSWRARMRLEQRTKPQALKGDKKEEDAPARPTSPAPVLLPQQETNEAPRERGGVRLRSPSNPRVLAPQQQETGEGDLDEEDPPVSPYSPRRTWIKEYLRTNEPDKMEDPPVPPTSPPSVLLPQQRQTGEGDEKEEDAPVPPGSPNQREEVVAERTISLERFSLSPEQTKVDRLFQAQLSSSAGLDSLIRENPEALADIQRVVEAQAAGRFSPVDKLSDMERHRKLGTLVAMSTALGEVALRHTEDMDTRRKELALPLFSKAYYTAVRSGVCNAYLAASVINSDWVSTSKTCGVGKAGAALKLLSSAVPVVGGLTGLAGRALETGDHYLQTRRLVKITAMAPDTVECCTLARSLALQLADGLRNDAGATADDADEVRVLTTAGMMEGSGCGRGADMMPGDMSEEDVFEYLLEEVASYEGSDPGGKRLGKKHVRKLLKAIQGGCLDGSSCTEQKIKVLLQQVLPEADVRPAATSSTPKTVIVRSPPVVAPVHDGRLPSIADFAALQIAVEELQAANDRQQEELEEQQAKIEAVESRNKQLRDQMAAMEKRVPEGAYEPGDRVNAGGRQVLQQKLETKEDLGTFWKRKENAGGYTLMQLGVSRNRLSNYSHPSKRGSVDGSWQPFGLGGYVQSFSRSLPDFVVLSWNTRARREGCGKAGLGGQGILTPAEHQAETRDTRALVNDVDDRVDFVEARLDALFEQQQAGKKQGFSQRRRRHR